MGLKYDSTDEIFLKNNPFQTANQQLISVFSGSIHNHVRLQNGIHL